MRNPFRHLHAPLATLTVLAATAAPAFGQWSRFGPLPAADVFTVEVQGDTILAGVYQAVWVSTDRGTNWTRSTDIPSAATSVESVRHVAGRLWAGTYGQGVFSSTDMGASWQPHSQGLAGGLFNSHLYVLDLLERGDSLFAATDGAGVYAIRLSAPVAWSAFGSAFTGSAAGGVQDLEEHGGRLLAPAGGNGLVFHNDRGAPDWTESYLNNFGPAPGLQARRAAWTGSAWLVSTKLGCYRSVDGTSPWTAVGPAGGGRTDGLVVSRDHHTYAAFNTLSSTYYAFSLDDGTTWDPLEAASAYTYDLGLLDGRPIAARDDGLWMRESGALAAPVATPPVVPRIRLVGGNPVLGRARLLLDLPAGGAVRLEMFDATGRAAGSVVAQVLPAGSHEFEWDAAGRPPGMYLARLTGPGGRAVAKFAVAR